MSKLKENCMIRLTSRIEQDGEPTDIELMTRGNLSHRGNSYYITYQETETTGYAGCTTTLKVAEDESRVAMLRFGPANSQLIIERGKRNLCHYETGYGSLTLGVTAEDIRSTLTDTGGHLAFSYVLDADGTGLLSKSHLDVTVSWLN